MYSTRVESWPRERSFPLRRLVALIVIIAPLIAGVVYFSRASGNVMALAFHGQLVEQGPAPTLFPGATTSYSVRFRNTGFISWGRGTSTQVTLGVSGDPADLVQAKIGVGWLSADRVATTAETNVPPGQIGTFNFTVRAPATPGVYLIPLRLVVDGVTWLEDEHVVVKLTSDLGFHSTLVDQSRHPVLKPGELSAPITVHIRNTGARTWLKGTPDQQVNLGLASDDKILAGLALGWPTIDRVAIQTEPVVGPGGLATFIFRVRAPATPGTYALRLRPVADGVTWLEDDGIVSIVTVTGGADVTPSQPAAAVELASVPRFTATATLDRASAFRGGAIAINATFTSTLATTAILGVEVAAPGGSTLVLQKWSDSLTFAAGEPRSFPVSWQIPFNADLGAYTVNLRAFGADWKKLFTTKDAATTFAVAVAPLAPSATPAPVGVPGNPTPPSTSSPGPTGVPGSTNPASTTPGSTPGPTATAAPSATVLPTASGAPTASAVPTATASPTPTATATPAPVMSFTSTARLGGTTVPVGGAIDVTATVTSASATNALVDVEIWAPGAIVAIYQVWFDDQSFVAGQQRSYPVRWQVPAGTVLGTYEVKLGVFAPHWATTWSWTNGAATFGVTAAAPSPTPTPAPSGAPTPTPTVPPVGGPMREISLLVPASSVYADNDANGARGGARDGLWSSLWRTSEVPASVGVPHWIAYDLSTIPTSSRQRVLSVWMNQQYDYDSAGASAYTLPGDYAIQANGASGGSLPGSGWVTLSSVTGNTKGAAMNALDLTGYNWVRIVVTAGAANDAAGNVGTALTEWQLFDASAGVGDSWMFVGDSITSNSFGNQDADGVDVVFRARTGRTPAWYKASHGGYKTDDFLAATVPGPTRLDDYLAAFPGRYVAIALGTNDASGQPNASTYDANLRRMIDKVLAAGKVPVIPKVIYSPKSSVGPNIPAFNAKVTQIWTDYGARLVKGPDLYQPFYDDYNGGPQTYWAGSDLLHPNSVGNARIRDLWATALAALAPGGPAPTPTPAPTPVPTPAPTAPPGGLPGLRVQGNLLVNALGQAVVFHGVNRMGGEYVCAQDRGFWDGPADQASINAMKAWRVTAIRIPLNEHCWLGIDDGAPTPQYIGENYRVQVESFVNLLIANNIYPILDMHWSAPAGQAANGQDGMPNTSYSASFWSSVASRFKAKPQVMFDLFNEPIPNNNAATFTDAAAAASWGCWRDGGAACTATQTSNRPGGSLTAAQTVGMQTLVDAVRGTGATNVIMLGGIQWANTLWSSATRSIVTYRPNDPTGNNVASFHVYQNTWCNTVACYDQQVAPISAQMPVVAGEMGNSACDATMLNTTMAWLDARSLGYLAWVWNASGANCGDIKLILDYAGTPSTYGLIYKTHLAALP